MRLGIRSVSVFDVWPFAFVTGLAASSIYLLSAMDFVPLRLAFILLTILLLIYLAIEVRRVRRLHPVRWLINPVVVCALMTFVLGFGMTNLIYFLPESSLVEFGVRPVVTASMNYLILLTIFGAIAMWLGYWSPLSRQLVKVPLAGVRDRFFKFDTEPRKWVLPALVLLSLISRLLQIWLGVFGYSSNYDRLIEAASYTQYLAMGSSLGKLALVIVALQYYSQHRSPQVSIWFFGVFSYEIIFGLLSGFKSVAIMPFIIVMLCGYLKSGHISRRWLLVIPLAVIIAFAVIEPFRVAKNADAEFQSTSVSSIADTMTGSALVAINEDTSAEEKASLLVTIMSRFNLTYVGSLGIKFADEHEKLPKGSPAFIEDNLLSPLYAWIPRLLWEEKPLANIGLWYTRTVMGFDGSLSSTAMGIITYLYFTGGVLAIFAGLFFIGFAQRVIFFTAQPWFSDAGSLVLLSMLPTIAVIAESHFNAILISLFRDLPIVLMLAFFLYKRTSPKMAAYDKEFGAIHLRFRFQPANRQV